MTTEQQLDTFLAGWRAMKWLAGHARTDCPQCRIYRKMVDIYSRRPEAVLNKRCALARQAHEKYMAVERMISQMDGGFECDLIDAKRPDIRCSGLIEWALAERSRRSGKLISFAIGCEPHVRLAEAQAIIKGASGTFTIEKLEDVVREDPTKMR